MNAPTGAGEVARVNEFVGAALSSVIVIVSGDVVVPALFCEPVMFPLPLAVAVLRVYVRELPVPDAVQPEIAGKVGVPVIPDWASLTVAVKLSVPEARK